MRKRILNLNSRAKLLIESLFHIVRKNSGYQFSDNNRLI